MKTQLNSFIRSLFAVIFSLFANPQRARQVVFIVAVCLLLVALVIPTVATFAGGMIGGTGH